MCNLMSRVIVWQSLPTMNGAHNSPAACLTLTSWCVRSRKAACLTSISMGLSGSPQGDDNTMARIPRSPPCLLSQGLCQGESGMSDQEYRLLKTYLMRHSWRHSEENREVGRKSNEKKMCVRWLNKSGDTKGRVLERAARWRTEYTRRQRESIRTKKLELLLPWPLHLGKFPQAESVWKI